MGSTQEVQRFTIAGRPVEISPDQVIRALGDMEPEVPRDHFVVVDGRRFPPKQVLAVVTGIDRGDFTTHQARSVLRRLGLDTGRVRRRSEGLAEPSSGFTREMIAEADALRPHIGRWVALRDRSVVAVADDPLALVAEVRRRGLRNTGVFRVPVDPTVDIGGFAL